MNDTDHFVAGMVLGAILLFILINLFFQVGFETQCERKYDVYDCDWEYYPVVQEEVIK